MAKLIQFPTSMTQRVDDTKRPEFSHQQLRLVVSNPCSHTIHKPTISHAPASSCFAVEVQPKGPNLYEMKVEDPSFGLACDLILEVENPIDGWEATSIICHFPNIDDQALNDFVEEDETLFGMFMIQFQMKILEQLLLFCANHYAATLTIFVDDVQADALGVYRDFLSYEEETFTAEGEKTEMVIPADLETYDDLMSYMDKMTQKFTQTLWCEQKNNPVIRQYLEWLSVCPS